jgi:hypothetical protein
MILGVAGLVIVGIIFSFVAGALPEVDMLTKIKHFAVKTIAVVRSHVILVSLFKLVLVGVLGYTLWVRVAGMLEGGVHLGAFIRRGGVLFWVVVLLMPVNWFLELVKWKRLVGRNQDLSYGVALRGLLLGVALSVITPNRLGELGGRASVLAPSKRWLGLAATLLGSVSLLVPLLGFGGVCLSGFGISFLGWGAGVWVVGLLLLVCCCWVYFHIPQVVAVLGRVSFLRSRAERLLQLSTFSRYDLWATLLLSGMRYGVYVLQYILLLLGMGASLSASDFLEGVGVIYFIQTGIPLPPITGLLVRGHVALQIWAYYGLEADVIMGATVVLWVINILLPSIVGGLVLLFHPIDHKT